MRFDKIKFSRFKDIYENNNLADHQGSEIIIVKDTGMVIASEKPDFSQLNVSSVSNDGINDGKDSKNNRPVKEQEDENNEHTSSIKPTPPTFSGLSRTIGSEPASPNDGEVDAR